MATASTSPPSACPTPPHSHRGSPTMEAISHLSLPFTEHSVAFCLQSHCCDTSCHFLSLQPTSIPADTLIPQACLSLRSFLAALYPPTLYYTQGHRAKSLPSFKPVPDPFPRRHSHPPGEHWHGHLLFPRCSRLLTYSVF